MFYPAPEPGQTRRIAHAVRGLKFTYLETLFESDESHRSCGAWIEMSCDQ